MPFSKVQAPAAAASRAKADDFAEHMRPVIEGMQSKGITSANELTVALNNAGIASRQGRTWHPGTLKKLLARLGQREFMS